MRTLTITSLLATAALAATAPTAGAAGYNVYSGYSEGPVAGAPSSTYVLRASFIAPTTWKAAKAKRDATTRRFGPIGSCKFKVTVTARAIADVDEAATARVARLLPVAARYVHDQGTRGNAAFRVIRQPGTDVVTGLLVRPAPSVRSQPAGKRVWLELRAVGVADPKTECHSGGPRSVAAGFGDMFAVGSLGGFEPR